MARVGESDCAGMRLGRAAMGPAPKSCQLRVCFLVNKVLLAARPEAEPALARPTMVGPREENLAISGPQNAIF